MDFCVVQKQKGVAGAMIEAAFILSEGDHRLYRVEPWTKAHQRTLSRCLGSDVKPRDLTDDR
jgi:hypothetical protein